MELANLENWPLWGRVQSLGNSALVSRATVDPLADNQCRNVDGCSHHHGPGPYGPQDGLVRGPRHYYDQSSPDTMSNIILCDRLRWIYDEYADQEQEERSKVDTKLDGLQSLDEWKIFFNQPGASTLALYVGSIASYEVYADTSKT
jgi:hypothetical protein